MSARLLAEKFQFRVGRENGAAQIKQHQHTHRIVNRLNSRENGIGRGTNDIFARATGVSNRYLPLRHLPGQFGNASGELRTMRDNYQSYWHRQGLLKKKEKYDFRSKRVMLSETKHPRGPA